MKKIYLLIPLAVSMCFGARIGVLKYTDKCPGEQVVIRLDTEDNNNNNQLKGYLNPAIDISKKMVKFTYCVLERDVAPRASFDYVVLRLSQKCPAGAYAFRRHHDTENDNNNNWKQGNISPSVVNKDATLEYCFVPKDASLKPTYPFAPKYGVFANYRADNIFHTEIYIDDEDNKTRVCTDATRLEELLVPGTDGDLVSDEVIVSYEECTNEKKRNLNSWYFWLSQNTIDELKFKIKTLSSIRNIMSGDENTTMHAIRWNGKSLKKEANMVVVEQAAPAAQPLSPEIKGFDHSAVTVELKSAGSVNVSIVNLKGAVVANIARENLQPGFHSLEWHSGIVPNGRYIVTVKQNGLVSAKNVILK